MYEFGGPFGAVAIPILVILFSYHFNLACGAAASCSISTLYPIVSLSLPSLSFLSSLFSLHDSLLYLAFYLFLVLCFYIIPGPRVDGSLLRSGTRLQYKLNAFSSFLATLLALFLLLNVYGLSPLVHLYDHAPQFVTATLIMSFAQSFYSYYLSYSPNALLSLGGQTPSHIYNWFIGRCLNPRIGSSFDIKTFNELRPGLILWFLIDISALAKQYSLYQSISPSLILVVIFQSIYVVDALYQESSILTQMDITTDGFGFMLSVGDLTWVPWTYSLQSRYLATSPLNLSTPFVLFILFVNLSGYLIFRLANHEKDQFRKGNNPRQLKSMETKRGTNLLIEGWWGLSRHPNYLGDWTMAWAWCLPTAFETPLTYFYVIYFAILLIHRRRRDDAACREKYGSDWDKYCKIVKWKIIPYVY